MFLLIICRIISMISKRIVTIILLNVILFVNASWQSSLKYAPTTLLSQSMPRSTHFPHGNSEVNFIRQNSISPYSTITCRISVQQQGEFHALNITPEAKLYSTGYQCDNVERLVELQDLSSIEIPFEKTWSIQKAIVASHVDRLKADFKGKDSILSSQFCSRKTIIETTDDVMKPSGHDCVIMLQHEPVYTLGTASDENFIKSSERNTRGNDNDITIFRIDRGGEVTYHGPGQLVMYPLLDLRGYNQDIHWYLRALEEVVLLALSRVGVDGATREAGITGIWIQQKKVAAFGVKLRKWVTMHGLAVNVERQSVENFGGIVPCGLVGREVCCINDFLDVPITVQEFSVHLARSFEDVFKIEFIENQSKL